MGKNQSASNLTNIIKQDGSGNIVFTSGSTTLATISTSGQLSGSTAVKSATTASYADNFTVTGNLTAQTLIVQTITSSVDFVTGSTRFGSTLANTHQFTGSVNVTGSIGINVTSSIFPFHLAAAYSKTTTTGTAQMFISTNEPAASNPFGLRFQVFGSSSLAGRYASLQTTDYNSADGGNIVLQAGGGNVGIGTTNPTVKLNLIGGEMRWGYTSDLGSLSFTDNKPMLASVGATDFLFYTNAAERMRITSGGNVGIGVNPATFDTIGPILQMGRAIFYGYSNEAALGANFRYEGGDKYINSDYGCLYQMKNGTHVFSTAPSGTAGAAMTLTARMIIANSGAVTFINNSVKKATLTKLVSVGASSTSNMSFNVSSELGVPGAGYIMVEISAIGYGGAGSNGMIYKAIVGGYSGHTLNPSYHKYSEYVSAITNGSVSIYNPTADVYGITVTNNAGSQPINIILRLDVTWYG